MSPYQTSYGFWMELLMDGGGHKNSVEGSNVEISQWRLGIV